MVLVRTEKDTDMDRTLDLTFKTATIVIIPPEIGGIEQDDRDANCGKNVSLCSVKCLTAAHQYVNKFCFYRFAKVSVNLLGLPLI